MSEKPLPKSSPEETALRILARRDHSINELRVKLTARGYAAADVETLLVRFGELGYLDDARFARMMRHEYLEVRRRGPQALRAALRKAKVAEELVAELMAEVAEAGHTREVLLTLAHKKLALLNRRESGKRRDKLTRFLVGRGFAYDDVARVVDEALRLAEDAGQEENNDDYDGA